MKVVITIFSILLTIGIYSMSLKIHRKYPSPFTMPIFFCTVIIICVLLMTGITFDQYRIAKDIMTYLLGPATVALAVPLYKQKDLIVKHLIPLLIGLMIGTLATIVSAVYLSLWTGLSKEIVKAFSIKSITIPIASEVAHIIEANPTLVAGFVMITGMLGAMFGSMLLNIAKIFHPIARGLSFGTISHGIGTAQAMKEGDIQGATSGVAIGLTGIFTSLMIPWLLPLLVN